LKKFPSGCRKTKKRKVEEDLKKFPSGCKRGKKQKVEEVSFAL